MKRVSLNLFLLLFFALFANAQESKYRKPVVVVNYFNKSSEIKSGDCELARNAVLSSLSNYPRLRVIDVETESSIDQETKRRLKEEALADELARSGQMKQLGADYILEGFVSKLETQRKTDSEGKVSYKGQMAYTIKVVSTENGTVAFSNNYTASSGSCDTEAEARTKALKDAAVTCEMIEAVFPLNGILVDQDYTEKKGKMKTCYVTLGSIHGVVEGVFLDVRKSKNIASRTVYEEVGVLKVEKVLADDLSECSVVSNGKEILEATKEYTKMKTINEEAAKPLLVSSRCDTGNLFKDIIHIFK
ncbi:CsgG/HfaB family protein [uncultured Bacteroides sp.]|uniref:CsgG/HfaB family protein n=1 Tax=uncultured Bacteroides sp. TaxID=162156 RepID=UPI00259824C1|nr:CsgG/HfaB family protein [uncultured Bacteroides sp.]